MFIVCVCVCVCVCGERGDCVGVDGGVRCSGSVLCPVVWPSVTVEPFEVILLFVEFVDLFTV